MTDALRSLLHACHLLIPAEMHAGDCLFINGRVAHGGGANRTADFKRRAVA